MLGDFEFNVEYRTDDYAIQRGLEKVLYDLHPEAMASAGGFNKIRPVALGNPSIGDYMKAANAYLQSLH